MPQITVTTDEVVAAGNTINSLSGQIEELIGQLRSTAESVSGAWTGPAASAFESAMQEWNTAAVAIKSAAADIGLATRTAGTNYSDTEAANRSMFR